MLERGARDRDHQGEGVPGRRQAVGDHDESVDEDGGVARGRVDPGQRQPQGDHRELEGLPEGSDTEGVCAAEHPVHDPGLGAVMDAPQDAVRVVGDGAR